MISHEQLEKTRPRYERGMLVMVNEPNIDGWYGVAMSLKPSRQSGWWYEVEREDGLTFAVHSKYVEAVGEEAA